MGSRFWSLSQAGFEGDLYAKNPWDLVTLGGRRIPGISKVKGIPALEVDRQKQHGGDGASLILRGYLPGPLEIETLIWTPAQWAVMQDIIARVWRRPGKIAPGAKEKSSSAIAKGAVAFERNALDIAWPGLEPYAIRSVVVVGVSVPEDGGVTQSKTVRMKLIEFVPPSKKHATEKPKGSASNEKLHKKLETKNHTEKKPSETDSGPAGPPKVPHGGSH